MSDVFISYSRKDIAFARLLHEALKENGLETWIDWQDIPPSADWLAEVYQAIEQTDTFIFVISPTSVQSEVCGLEIAHATKHNKRIVPLVIDDIDSRSVPSQLAALNWIFFREEDQGYRDAVRDLITAIRVDQAWVKEHTRYQNRALEWERKGQDRGFLLRGADLRDGEIWLARAADKDPQPTALQTRYMLASRQDATRRQRIVLGAAGVGLAVATVLGILAWTQRNVAVAEGYQRATAEAVALQEAHARATEVVVRSTAQAVAEEQRAVAEEQRRIAEARMLSAMALNQIGSNLDLALLLSVEGVKKDRNYLTVGSLLSSLIEDTRLLRHVHGQGLMISDASFSPDGKYIATGGLSDAIRLWDPLTGKLLEEGPFMGEDGAATDIDFSPDGKTVASIRWDDTVRFWDIASGLQLSGTATTVGWYFHSVEYSPHGELLAAGDSSGRVAILDPNTKETVHALNTELARESISRLAFSPQGDVLASGGLFDEIFLWDPLSGKKLLELPTGHGEVYGLAFTPDGETLVTGGDDGYIRFWDHKTGALLQSFSGGDRGSVRSLAITPDGRHMFSSYADHTTIIWNVRESRSLGVWSTLAGDILDISPDGYFLVSLSDDIVRLWSVYSRVASNIPFSGHTGSVSTLDFTPDGKYLLSGSYDHTLRLWDVATGEAVGAPFAGHTDRVESAAIRPDGEVLVSGGWDHTIRFWDIDSGNQVGEPIDVGTIPVSLLFSPDGGTLVASVTFASLDPVSVYSKILIWDADTMEQVGEIAGEYELIDAIAFNLDGSILALGESNLEVLSSTEGRQIRLWDVRNAVQLGNSLVGHERPVQSLDFNGDGRILVSNDSDGGIRFWDVEAGKQIGDPVVDTANGDESATYIPNTDFVALAGDNQEGVIRILDSITHLFVGAPIDQQGASGLSIAFPGHAPLVGYPGHGTRITALAASPDGKFLASGADDGSIRLYDLDLDSWIARACLRAGRNLSQAEWNVYRPSEAYAATCPQFP